MIVFSKPLTKATLIRRYKRFLADAALNDGTVVTAHCPNTGSMNTCGAPQDTIYLLHSDDKKRKLSYTWELTETEGGFIGINTHRPNRIVEDAIARDAIPELLGYANMKREVKYGTNSKIDLLLTDPEKKPCYVEIKNVTLLEGPALMFPDAVSVRAQKHLKELEKAAQQGKRSVIFFLCNRPEGKYVDAAKHIDPKYAEALDRAISNGVEAICYRVDANLKRLTIGESVPIKITKD